MESHGNLRNSGGIGSKVTRAFCDSRAALNPVWKYRDLHVYDERA